LLVHHWHDNADVTLPWQRGQTVAGPSLYMVFTTGHVSDAPFGDAMGRSVLARSDNDGLGFGSPIYELSRDKFVNVSLQLIRNQDFPGLPDPDGDGLLIWGSGAFRRSNVYLAYLPAGSIEDRTAIRYYRGSVVVGLADRHPAAAAVVVGRRQPGARHDVARHVPPLRVAQATVSRRDPVSAVPHRTAWRADGGCQRLVQQARKVAGVAAAAGRQGRLERGRRVVPRRHQVRGDVLVRAARPVQVRQQPVHLPAAQHLPDHSLRARPAAASSSRCTARVVRATARSSHSGGSPVAFRERTAWLTLPPNRRTCARPGLNHLQQRLTPRCRLRRPRPPRRGQRRLRRVPARRQPAASRCGGKVGVLVLGAAQQHRAVAPGEGVPAVPPPQPPPLRAHGGLPGPGRQPARSTTRRPPPPLPRRCGETRSPGF
jgi:hypothetical protein